MRTVTIKVSELLPVVEKNREEHRKEFLEAQEGFRKKVIENLDRMLEDARQNKRYELYVGLQAPIDQTKEYDTVIKMLKLTSEDTVTLTNQEFMQYVQDEWGWSAMTKAINSTYIPKELGD